MPSINVYIPVKLYQALMKTEMNGKLTRPIKDVVKAAIVDQLIRDAEPETLKLIGLDFDNGTRSTQD